MNKIGIDGNSLSLNDLYKVALGKTKVYLRDAAILKVDKCRAYVEKIVAENRVVYGLTTGFGKFSNIVIEADKIEELQENLILSHATGVGRRLSIEETRAVMLLRCNVLAKGYSGIRRETLQTLIDMLNAEIHPCIPEKGSVGASGDLAPLSHLALVLLGKGEAEYQGEIISGAEAMSKAGIKPVKLAAKEGLALNNGTQVMTAINALSLIKALNLCKTADVSAALSLDSLLGTTDAYDELIHNVREHKGQGVSAGNLRKLLAGSKLRESHLNCSNVQDPYSLRCVPQVHGAVRDNLAFAERSIEIEINSATDNPLIFPDDDKVLSGGNFHGEPMAFAADIMAMTMSEIGNIAERRIEQMCNPALNRGLNAFLAPRPGLDSGFMIAQVTAASLVSENKTKCFPASVDSVPTSANQEDHVSMGTIGAVKAREVINNTAYILAIELIMTAQAIDERKISSSAPLEDVRKMIRTEVPHLSKDRILYNDIETVKKMIDERVIVDTISAKIDIE